MADVIAQFRQVLLDSGILVDTVQADGKLHRVPVEGGKSGREDGAYVLHLDGLPSGGFINWRDGLGWQTWSAKRDRAPTQEERAVWRARMNDLKHQRYAEETTRHVEAAERAGRLLRASKLATDSHLYLVNKGVKAYGLRQMGEQLVIPVRDIGGNLTTLQFISPEGDKRFLTGGRKRGCYFAIGVPRETLCVCEGYATAASVVEATGFATAVAFDAGNLEPVALALRGKFPTVEITLCADNDAQTPGNPGVSCAIKAARAVRGRVAIPQFYGMAL